MRACGNDVPRAFVVLFLFPVSEGFAPDSLFLGGFHRSPLLEYPPTCSSPGNFGGVFATSALGFFSRGGIFGSRPLDRKTWTQKFTRISVSRTTIARRPSSPRGTSARSSERPTAPLRMSGPADRPRRLGDVPSVRVRKERPRACGRAGVRGRRRARCARVVRLFLTH